MARDLAFGLSVAVLSVLVYNFFNSNKKCTRRKADDTGASSSSATSTGSDNYDVFLSFNGKDTRKTIVDHLYNGLVDVGIRVFRDDNELREGEEIGPNLLQAIKNSKISIAILSQNYASSKWCLQELVEMTECMKSAGQIVLPVFYRVEPAHVRYQRESFGKTFSRLSRKYLEEDVVKWKQALQELASLKGWESERTANGHEGELVKMVVKKVSSELKKAFLLVVPERLVGIDNAVEDILRLLDDNRSATQIVGIHGMGGIGKTTLAKFIYNKLSSQFHHCSFIADIRESTRRKGISSLHNQVISDILKMDDQVSNTDEGIRIMESRFKCKKVLLLLDDVDDKDQVQALVGKHDWFEMGSRIIITTRIRSVLDDAGVKSTYEPKEIDDDKSLILFSRHAFMRDSPPCEFEPLSRAVVSTTGGLPLALEVIGSSLCGRDRAFWQDALEKLQKAPHGKVQEKLRISYDVLNHEEKQIFLDIACFFNGLNRLAASCMWEACNFLPNMGIETLSLMSLVKIEDNGDLRMHDQLIDLGREIVRQEDYNTPMNRSRLWIQEEVCQVLQRNKGKEKDRVQALWLDENPSQVELTTQQFETLPNLRLLLLQNATLIGDSRGLLPQLRFLSFEKCPASVLTSFHLEKLVALFLFDCDISELWEGWSRLQVANQLKALALENSHCLKVSPDLSTFQNLEILIFDGCRNLEQIHSSVGEAKGLLLLNVRGCQKLQKLPQEIGNLEELTKLCIGETAIEEIPTCIVSSKKLEIIVASDCKSLVRLPDSITHLINLWHLDLSGCSKLCRLPECIGSLVKLQYLSLEGVGIPEDSQLDHPPFHVPSSIGMLERLTELDLSRSGICELPKSIGDLKNLKILNIAHCEKLRSLPSTIGKLGSLEKLDATECQGLGGEIHIDGLSSLKILRLSSTRVSGLFNKVSRLEKLEELDATNCKSLGGEIPIDGLSSLKILRLRSTDVSGFPDEFDKLSHLEKLDLQDCKMLQSLPQSISKLPSLQLLNSVGCANLQSLPELPACLKELAITCQHHTLPQLSHLIHLRLLSIVGCGLLESMPELPSGILELLVQHCDRLKELPSLSNLEFLSQLTIDSCSKLTEIKDLEALKNLTKLSISRCVKLSSFDGLEHLHSLRFLQMDTFPRLNDDRDQARGLDKLKNLEELRVWGYQSLVGPDLSQLTRLKQLGAHECQNLFEIKGLERLKDLETLVASGCKSLVRLPDSIGKLERLTKLNLSQSGICELPESIGELKNLRILNVARCEKLRSLPSTIGKLVSLEQIDATECQGLGGEIHIDGLSSLKILRLSSTWVSGLFDKVSRLEKLEELDATNCKSLAREIPIDGLSSLKILRLRSTDVSGFPDDFDKLSRLEKLDLQDCKMLQSLPQSISKLPSLQLLNLVGCANLQSLPELPACLKELAVTCQHHTLPQLSHLIHLRLFSIVGCGLLESMPELPSGILCLYVRHCDRLTELPSLSNLEFLSQLTIDSGSKLTEIKDLEALKNLTKLSISRCVKLSSFDGLEHLQSLRFLLMDTFPRLNDDRDQARGLDKLKNLEELWVWC